MTDLKVQQPSADSLISDLQKLSNQRSDDKLKEILADIQAIEKELEKDRVSLETNTDEIKKTETGLERMKASPEIQNEDLLALTGCHETLKTEQDRLRNDIDAGERRLKELKEEPLYKEYTLEQERLAHKARVQESTELNRVKANESLSKFKEFFSVQAGSVYGIGDDIGRGIKLKEEIDNKTDELEELSKDLYVDFNDVYNRLSDRTKDKLRALRLGSYPQDANEALKWVNNAKEFLKKAILNRKVCRELLDLPEDPRTKRYMVLKDEIYGNIVDKKNTGLERKYIIWRNNLIEKLNGMGMRNDGWVTSQRARVSGWDKSNRFENAWNWQEVEKAIRDGSDENLSDLKVSLRDLLDALANLYSLVREHNQGLQLRDDEYDDLVKLYAKVQSVKDLL
ncbi:hypothetical protein KJ764_05745 [Patescibacteria group bacterium]|nr:hypothetical protein [Patescibacteria group bacterium]